MRIKTVAAIDDLEKAYDLRFLAVETTATQTKAELKPVDAKVDSVSSSMCGILSLMQVQGDKRSQVLEELKEVKTSGSPNANNNNNSR